MMTSYATPALPSQNWFLQFLEETEVIQIIQCSDFLNVSRLEQCDICCDISQQDHSTMNLKHIKSI